VTSFVLDNSVAMRWCFDEATHPYAEGILERLETGDDAVVPVIWLYEASAVLARAQNRGTLAAHKADGFIDELRSLNIVIDGESAARVFPDAHRVALAYRLTSYDAAYLELALRRRLPLATLDDDLIRASKAAGVIVITLTA
jgi:predicted nucleic acid-binding protein